MFVADLASGKQELVAAEERALAVWHTDGRSSTLPPLFLPWSCSSRLDWGVARFSVFHTHAHIYLYLKYKHHHLQVKGAVTRASSGEWMNDGLSWGWVGSRSVYSSQPSLVQLLFLQLSKWLKNEDEGTHEERWLGYLMKTTRLQD